jgi:hypothetical protein
MTRVCLVIVYVLALLCFVSSSSSILYILCEFPLLSSSAHSWCTGVCLPSSAWWIGRFELFVGVRGSKREAYLRRHWAWDESAKLDCREGRAQVCRLTLVDHFCVYIFETRHLVCLESCCFLGIFLLIPKVGCGIQSLSRIRTFG